MNILGKLASRTAFSLFPELDGVSKENILSAFAEKAEEYQGLLRKVGELDARIAALETRASSLEQHDRDQDVVNSVRFSNLETRPFP